MADVDDQARDDEARDLYLGRVVDGRYRVTRCLGAGGMGSVYEAEHLEMERKVALKILHAQLAKDPGVVRRFRNEARASATLGHPGIAQAFDFGRTDDGAPFIAMELLRGPDLGEVIEDEGPMPFERAVAITDQIADALGAAHDAGIVHRDVKPENVLLLAGDVVKVLDFGISKLTDGQSSVATRTGTFLGSPSYMSPEQVKDASRADARTDIYALGAVLYAMLSGRPMFSHSSLPMLIVAITNDPPPPLESLRADTPASLVALIERMTDKDAAARPQTMAAVREELAALGPLDGSAPTRPPPRPEPVTDAAPVDELPVSRPPIVAIAAVAGAIVLAVGAYAWRPWEASDPDPAPAVTPPAIAQPTIAQPPGEDEPAPEPPSGTAADEGTVAGPGASTAPASTAAEPADTAPREPAPDPATTTTGRRAGRRPRAPDPVAEGDDSARPPTAIDGVPIDDTY